MGSYTPNTNFYKADPVTDGKQTFNINTLLNQNWDKADVKFGELQNSVGQLQQSVSNSVPAAPNSVTDSFIGNRTLDPTKQPSGNTGTLTDILSWMANLLSSITGKANWWEKPTKTIDQLNQEKANKSGDSFTGNLSITRADDSGINLSATSGPRYVGLWANIEGFIVAKLNAAGQWQDHLLQIWDDRFKYKTYDIFHAGNLHLLTSGNKAKTVTGDWNNCTDTGFYMGSGLTNQCPGTNSWKYTIVVQHNSDWILQVSYDFDGTGAWYRMKKNGTWTAWKPHGEVYLKQGRTNKDARGQFVEVTEKRSDGTLYRKRIMSNQDSFGNYLTMTEIYYDNAGTTEIERKTYTQTYDMDGDCINIE